MMDGSDDLDARVSVVICTLGRPGVLEGAIDSLVRCTPAPSEVVVVDGDPARSAEPVANAHAATSSFPVEYVHHEPGLTRQRNAGLATATGDVVVFLDDDARATPTLIGRLVDVYGRDDIVGATGRVLEPSSHRIGHQTSRLRRLLFSPRREGTFTRSGYPRRLTALDHARPVELMPGCFMSARLAAARRVGFDERLTGYALGEDEDFSRRLSRIGSIVYEPTLVVEHDNSGFGSRDRRAFSRQVVLNRAYLFRKNFEQTPLAKLQFAGLLAVLLAHRLVNADGDGARGIVDGVRELMRRR